MIVTIKTNVAKLMADLDRVGREQVPYAMARTLSGLAFDARDKIRADLATQFTIRNSWVSKGIQTVNAQKRDWPMQQAIVGTRDEFMARQELGGKKQARGDTLAVPVDARKVVGSSRGELRPNTWPSKIVGKGKGGGNKFFVNTIRTGRNAGLEAVFRRSDDARYPLQVIYLMKKSVEVKPRWAFMATTQDVVNRNYAAKLGAELSKAIATARSGG